MTDDVGRPFRPPYTRREWLVLCGVGFLLLVFLATYETRPFTATLRNGGLEVFWPRGLAGQDKRIVLPVAWLYDVRWLDKSPSITKGWGTSDHSRGEGNTEFGHTLRLLDRTKPPYLLVWGQQAPEREDIAVVLSLPEEQRTRELFAALRAEFERRPQHER